ncbi:hypothetical protein BJV74DRAFT_894451 [Russula compacta]|nr:hypothetical protein BJV74DRAFT_894451 [Russula compacta]
MVNIHLRKTDGTWIHALIIPLEDIGRLSLCPLKWLRFAAFAAVGAKGHLSDTPGGNQVNYENVSLADLAENDNYYFSPEGDYRLVDLNGLNDQITTTSLTQHRSDFHHHDVAVRDGDCCVITKIEASICDAAHIIPHSKGDEYIHFVISDRSVLYEVQEIPTDIKINSTQNGIFLRTDLHSLLGYAQSSFLKIRETIILAFTPNFALNPADIPRVETGTIPASRVTMQHVTPLVGLDQVQQWDVLADWSSPLAPPSILLDYIYGVAIIKRWAINDFQVDCHQATYSAIPPLPRSYPSTHHKSKESELSQAMETAFLFSAFFKGYPQGRPWQWCGRYKRRKLNCTHVKSAKRKSKGGWK